MFQIIVQWLNSLVIKLLRAKLILIDITQPLFMRGFVCVCVFWGLISVPHALPLEPHLQPSALVQLTQYYFMLKNPTPALPFPQGFTFLCAFLGLISYVHWIHDLTYISLPKNVLCKTVYDPILFLQSVRVIDLMMVVLRN
jgi:hypothetical protein